MNTNIKEKHLAEQLTRALSKRNCGQYSPRGFLAALVDEVKQTQGLSTDEAIAFIAGKGEQWHGGEWGRISVSVYDPLDDEPCARWAPYDGHHAIMRDLLCAIPFDSPPYWIKPSEYLVLHKGLLYPAAP